MRGISLPLKWHVGFNDNWNWEADENNIRNHVAGAHGHELSDALSAHRSWVWNDLPVVIERLTFGEGCDDDCNERDEQEPANAL